MSALERRGHITHPERLPRLRTENPPLVPREAPSFPSFGLREAQPHANGSAVRQPEQRPTQIPQVDPYQYIAKLVERGVLTSEQGMEIVGKPDAQRRQIVSQIQEQERREEAALRQMGIYEEAMRLNEIEAELNKTQVPIEGAYRAGFQEWRSSDEFKKLNFRQTLTNVLPGSHPLVDVILVDNEDGTQTRYVDRAQHWYDSYLRKKPNSVYREEYGPRRKLKDREFISRERVGDHIEVRGAAMLPDGRLEREYYVITDRQISLQQEAMKLHREVERKEKESFFSQINMGEKGFVPTKKEEMQRKTVEDSIERMLWSVKDTPKEKLIFAGRNLGTNFLFYSLFQTVLPDFESTGGMVARGSVGAGFAGLNLLGLFNWQDVKRYVKAHPVMTAFQIGSSALFFMNPYFGLAAYGLMTVYQLRNLPGQVIERMKSSREFKKAHPEITDKKQRKEAFGDFYREKIQEKAINEFVELHKDWLQELKELNPAIPEDMLKQAMLLKGAGYQQGTMELGQILTDLNNRYMTAASLPRFAALPLAGVINALLLATGLPPLADKLISALGASAVATGGSMLGIDNLLSHVKEEIGAEFPELLPENRRTNGAKQTVSS